MIDKFEIKSAEDKLMLGIHILRNDHINTLIIDEDFYFLEYDSFIDIGGIEKLNIDYIDCSKVKALFNMFEGMISLKVAPKLINTENVNIIDRLFFGCKSLELIPYFDTKNVTSAEEAFSFCEKLTEIPNLDTGNIINFIRMFSECYSLKTIPLLNTKNGKYFNRMFSMCKNLKTVPFLDLTMAENTEDMFEFCEKLNSIGFETNKNMFRK